MAIVVSGVKWVVLVVVLLARIRNVCQCARLADIES